jgi:opacity protein-like surface antigen
MMTINKPIIKLLVAAGIAASGALPAGQALAQNYVGMSGGVSQWDVNCSGSSSCDKRDVAFKIYAGGSLSDYFGLEVGTISLGKAKAIFPTADGDIGSQIKAYGIDFAGVGKIPLGEGAYVFGKLGLSYMRVDAKDTFQGLTFDASDNSTQPMAGIGAVFYITKQLGVRGEVEYRRLSAYNQKYDTTSVTLGAQYQF